MTLTAVAINLKQLAVDLGRGRAPGNVVAMRVEDDGWSRISTIPRLHRLIGRLGALFPLWCAHTTRPPQRP